MKLNTKFILIVVLFFVINIILIQSIMATQMQKTIIDRENGYRIIKGEGEETPIGLTTFESRDEKIQILWEGYDSDAITGQISVSTVTGNSFVGWNLNNNRCSLYHDCFYPLWESEFGDDYDFAIDMLADGSRMAAGADNLARIFEADSNIPIWQQSYAGPARGMALSPDGLTVYVGVMEYPTTYIYAIDIITSDTIWENSFSGGCNGLVLSGNGEFLVYSQYDNIYVMKADDGSIIFQAPNQNQWLPAISYDGSILINGDYNGDAYVYEYDEENETYEQLWSYHVWGGGQYVPWVTGMAVSGDGSTIAIGTSIYYMGEDDGMVYLFNSDSPDTLWTFRNMGDLVSCIDMSYDGSIIAVGGWGPIDNSTPDFFLFNKESNEPVFSINSPGSIKHLDISSDGTLCTVGGKAVHCHVWGNGGTLYCISCTPPGIGDFISDGYADALTNYPNPFSNSTTFKFALKDPGHVKLSVYNIKGQRVATVIDEEMKPGFYEIPWSPTDGDHKLKNGIYFYRLEAGEKTFVKKMVIMQ